MARQGKARLPRPASRECGMVSCRHRQGAPRPCDRCRPRIPARPVARPCAFRPAARRMGEIGVRKSPKPAWHRCKPHLICRPSGPIRSAAGGGV